MVEREIQYDRTGKTDGVQFCPVCGTKTKCVWACAACWQEHGIPKMPDDSMHGDGLIFERDRLYAIGFHLRAEGKIPALAKVAEKPDDGQRYGVWVESQSTNGWALKREASGSFVKAVGPRDEMVALCREYNAFGLYGVTYSVRPYTDPSKPVDAPSPATLRSPTVAPPAPLIPDEETLARLLFASDDAVRAAIDVGDDRGWHHCEREEPYALSSAKLLDRAWARTTGVEAERREWAVEMARRVFAVAAAQRKDPSK